MKKFLVLHDVMLKPPHGYAKAGMLHDKFFPNPKYTSVGFFLRNRE